MWKKQISSKLKFTILIWWHPISKLFLSNNFFYFQGEMAAQCLEHLPDSVQSFSYSCCISKTRQVSGGRPYVEWTVVKKHVLLFLQELSRHLQCLVRFHTQLPGINWVSSILIFRWWRNGSAFTVSIRTFFA